MRSSFDRRCPTTTIELRSRDIVHVVLWSSVKSAQNSTCFPLGDNRDFCFCFPYASRQMYFQQKSGRRSPHTTARNVGSVYGWQSLTSSPPSDFKTLSMIRRTKCVEYKSPRFKSNICLRISQAGAAQDRRQKCISFGKLESSEKQLKTIGSTNNSPGIFWLVTLTFKVFNY